MRFKTNQLNITDGGEISVSGQQLGKAGNLNVTADTLRLDNKVSIRADVKSSSEGNIKYKSQFWCVLCT